MRILITGAKGFVGKNLCAQLENLRDGKSKFPGLDADLTLLPYDIDAPAGLLEQYCQSCDFVFHLAGVNRPKDPAEFARGNKGFTAVLLAALERCHNPCPVMLSSSVQAAQLGRYSGSLYGASKLAGEELVFAYSQRSGAPVYVYRFPNLFGKWCRPNYNSAVATFCHNIARNLPIQVNDPSTVLELLYIDDLVQEMVHALCGQPHRCRYEGLQPVPDPQGQYCYVPQTHTVTLGEIVDLLHQFHQQPQTLLLPEIPPNSFAKKLYSTYLSYLPAEAVSFPLAMHSDARGSFTELLKTPASGQISVNITKPGLTKGQHWHHSKWEFFIVVSGNGLIQQRKIGDDTVLEFPVSGQRIQAVHMLPGYTHNIINLSQTEDLITIMWANEAFDPAHPDTYYEPVVSEKDATSSVEAEQK